MNTVITVSPTTTTALAWVDKKGTSHSAHCPVAQAFAPRSARITAAQGETLRQLSNGQYAPFVRDLRACVGKADAKALTRLGYEIVPSNKAGVTRLLEAIVALWSDAKGKRASMAVVARAYLEACEASQASQDVTACEAVTE